MFGDVVCCGVPDVDAEGEVGLGFHGQVRFDSSWPAGIYTAMLRPAQNSTVQERRSMSAPRTGKLAPVTLGHRRAHGCRDLLVHCNSGQCNHSTTMNVGHLAADTEIAALGLALVCRRCGYVGARVTPNRVTVYRKHNKTPLGPLGDSLGDLTD